jgi:hypothetical protein
MKLHKLKYELNLYYNLVMFSTLPRNLFSLVKLNPLNKFNTLIRHQQFPKGLFRYNRFLIPVSSSLAYLYYIKKFGSEVCNFCHRK